MNRLTEDLTLSNMRINYEKFRELYSQIEQMKPCKGFIQKHGKSTEKQFGRTMTK